MSKYRVNRSGGWPIDRPKARQNTIIELPEDAAAMGVAQGYLLPVPEPEAPAADAEATSAAEAGEGEPPRKRVRK